MSESKGYTRSEVTSMQQDAIRRVREMQRRASQKLGNNSRNNYINNIEKSNNNLPIVDNTKGEKGKINRDVGLNLNGIFKLDLDLDEDKIMILLLIFVLSLEGADTILILALCYLII